MPITRRDILKLAAATATALGVQGLFPSLLRAAQSDTPPTLAVMKGKDHAKVVRAAVDALGGMGRFVKKGEKVVIKPNIGFGNKPEAATTTNPVVVRTLAEMALAAGAARVLVLDHPCHKAEIALDICGIEAGLKGLDNTYVYTITDEKFFVETPIPKARTLKQAAISKDILEADCIINAPTAKSHGSAIVSFGLKNWMGAIYSRKPFHVTHDLHQAIADLGTVIKPRLTVLDATRSLTTGGPGGPGEVVAYDTIIAGTDPLAVDAYGLSLGPWDGKRYKPEEIPQFQYAAAHGLGQIDLSKVRTVKKDV